MARIYLDAPNLCESDKVRILEAIDANYVSTAGPFVPEFEKRFAEFVGQEQAVSIQNGTAALHIALHELGVSRGDEVIVPALTFVATINPVLYVGAKPVIVDVDLDTWNISPVAIEKAITPMTKAIIPVHLYGNPCQMDEITRLASTNRLYVIEDATESLGAFYRGHPTGTIGDMGCFSFNGNKLITTGGGGMVVTKQSSHTEHIKFLVNQARDESQGYYHPEMGFNYRMTNIEAALGLSQIEKIDHFIQKKKAFRRIYQDILGDLSFVTFQQEYPGAESAWWLSCIRIKGELDIMSLIKTLKTKDIPTRRVFMPAGKMPYLRGLSQECPNAFDIYSQGLCLPSSTLNQEEDIKNTARIIRDNLFSLKH